MKFLTILFIAAIFGSGFVSCEDVEKQQVEEQLVEKQRGKGMGFGCTASCNGYRACIANGERYCTYTSGCDCNYPRYRTNCANSCTNYWYCRRNGDLCQYPNNCDCVPFKRY